MNGDIPIDQTIDPLALLIHSTAEEYKHYLKVEYATNREERWSIKDGWEAHYKKMRGAFRHCLMSIGERRNLAIIGPGFEPIGYDFDEEDISVFKELNAIVLADISQEVSKKAREAFIHAGVPAHKVHAIQYDITNGLSTVCHHFMEEQLQGIHSEEDLASLAERLEGLAIEELDAGLLGEVRKTHDKRHQSLLEGEINKERTWKLTRGGGPLPLDMVSYQMVLAGTLAHTMQAFRDRFVETTSRSEKVGKATKHARLEMFQRIHRLLTRFSTTIAMRSIRKVVADNPHTKVLGLTDVSTMYEEPRFGELTELNLDELSQQLAYPSEQLRNEGVMPIVTEVLHSWNWCDEPEHGHRVVRAEFEASNDFSAEDNSIEVEQGSNEQVAGTSSTQNISATSQAQPS